MAGKRKAPEGDTEAVDYEGRHPNAAATDAARLKARSKERDRIRKAQRLADGEKERQKGRAEIEKIQEESRKALASKA